MMSPCRHPRASPFYGYAPVRLGVVEPMLRRQKAFFPNSAKADCVSCIAVAAVRGYAAKLCAHRRSLAC